MSEWFENAAFWKKQYRDASKLDARRRLHILYSTNPYDWFLWVFDQFNLPGPCRILELGCGPGYLWDKNNHRIPQDWDISVSDTSEGMLHQARRNIQRHPHPAPHRFTYQVTDAQSIPWPEEHFDAVIAIHMLHLVPNKENALSEIYRVLKPEGHFYVTCMGERDLIELPMVVSEFDPEQSGRHQVEKNDFTLENGNSQLSEFFSEVTTSLQKNALIVTEAEPLVDYIISFDQFGICRERRKEFTRFIERKLSENDGTIPITKDSGMFIARKTSR